MNEELLRMLYKKATGYTVQEVVEEYSGDDPSTVIKRKVSNKYIPPDLTALKMYTELTCKDNPFVDMSDEDLQKEKTRLLAELKAASERGRKKK